MKVIEGGVTAAKGFKAACAEANIKYKNRTDMAMIYSEKPCTQAGVFTSNIVKAAPVRWDKAVVTDSPFAQAIVEKGAPITACNLMTKEKAEQIGKIMGIEVGEVIQ